MTILECGLDRNLAADLNGEKPLSVGDKVDELVAGAIRIYQSRKSGPIEGSSTARFETIYEDTRAESTAALKPLIVASLDSIDETSRLNNISPVRAGLLLLWCGALHCFAFQSNGTRYPPIWPGGDPRDRMREDARDRIDYARASKDNGNKK